MADLRALLGLPHAVRMLVAALIGRLPEAMIPLSVLLVVRAQGGSYPAAGALAAAFAVGAALGGPLAGRLVDRLGQPPILLATAAARGALLVAIAVAVSRSLAVAGVLVALCGALTPPLEPALRALWPDLAGGDERAVHAAYELDAGAQELIFVVGPLLVALTVAALQPTAALHVTAAIGLGGAAAFALAGPARRWRAGHAGPAHWTAAVRAPEVGVLLGVSALAGAATGAANVTTTAFAEHGLGDRALAGWLLAAWAVGALAGGLSAAAWRWRSPAEQRLTRLLVVFGLAFVPALLARSGVPMAFALAVAGAALAPTLACVFVLTGARAHPGTITETFAWLTSSFLVGSAVGSALGGALAGDAASTRGYAAAGALVLAGAGLWRLRPGARARSSRP